jgi:plastocyanin
MPGARTGLVLVLALGIVGIVGCGGGDDGAEATGTETATAPIVDIGTTLHASVGPGFEISFTTDDGPIERLAPGEYTIDVDDKSSAHNFHLAGPGVDEDSGVNEIGSSTWTVRFEEEGPYEFVCDPHAGSMNGDFEVTG